MGKYLFYYEVKYHIDAEEQFARGFLHADSYADAARAVDQYYEDVYTMELRMIGDGMLEIPNNIEFDLTPWEAYNGF